jgi:hypothetical protein
MQKSAKDASTVGEREEKMLRCFASGGSVLGENESKKGKKTI